MTTSMKTMKRTMMSAKTTTEPLPDGRRHDLVRKAVRVRALRDPLGAMGQRRTGARVGREARARRAVAVGTLASFLAIFGVVVATAPAVEPAVEPSMSQPAMTVPPPTARIAQPEVIRVVRVESRAPEEHVRSRAS
jgi:hypothetical protein